MPDQLEIVQKIKSLLRKQNFTRAKSIAEKAALDFPDQSEILTLAIDINRSLGDHEKSLYFTNLLIIRRPDEWRGYGLGAQDLIILNRLSEAQCLIMQGLEKLPNQLDLLRIASDVYRASGDIQESLTYAQLLTKFDPENSDGFIRTFQDKFSLGIFDDINDSFSLDSFPKTRRRKDEAFLRSVKLRHLNWALTSTWLNSFQIRNTENPLSKTTLAEWSPIQYWSQGDPPDEIKKITNTWDNLFQSINIPKIRLYDRKSAGEYISKHCPELTNAFNTAFHFAVEADVFRIAYAQDNNCIWIDSDLYPSTYSKDMLIHSLGLRKTTLLFKSHKPWVTNAFFATPAASPFFKSILTSMNGYDFSLRPRNTSEIFNSFGPGRFNATLAPMFAQAADKKNLTSTAVSNYVEDQLEFINELNFHAKGPPFRLKYKETKASWQKVYKRPKTQSA
jgi:hypothetical protein